MSSKTKFSIVFLFIVALLMQTNAHQEVFAQTAPSTNPINNSDNLQKDPFSWEIKPGDINPEFLRKWDYKRNSSFQQLQENNTQKQIRIIYLVPSDKTIRNDYQSAIADAILKLQDFFKKELGNGITFSVHSPIVEVYQTTHTSSWYATNPSRSTATQASYFFENTLNEGFSLTGGRFDDPNNRWIFYIDADQDCGQFLGGNAGIALMGANDLRGLIGEQNIPRCSNESPDNFGKNRWIGGAGHEIAHSFYVPHPPGCGGSGLNYGCTGGAFAANSIMWVGYAFYPNTYFLPEDKQIFLNSGFFSNEAVTPLPAAPDLQSENDTGKNNDDNLTNSRTPTFNISGVSNNATVELLRNYTVVDSAVASNGSIILKDDSPPANGTFSYSSRQIINNQPSSISAPLIVTYDTTIPILTIIRDESQLNPVNKQPINFRVLLSEEVTGFDAADVSLTGSTAGVSQANVAIVNFGTTYQIQISNILTDGIVRASVPAESLTDAAGNANQASMDTDNVVTLDTVAPTVTINQAIGQSDSTNALPIIFSVVFSEPVTGMNGNDVISLAGSTADVSFANVSVTGSGTNYTVSVSNISSNGQTVQASVRAGAAQDIAGNQSLASTSTDNTFTLDNVAPTVTINQAAGQSDPTSNQPVNFTVVFSESVTGFNTSDISFDGSTIDVSSANITVTGSGATYNVVVSNITSSGQVAASVTANAAQDAMENLSKASTSTDNIITITSENTSLRTSFDYDGDSKTDISIYRGDLGQWWYLRSSDGASRAYAFGSSTDKIIPADYTGDGKTDIAYFHPSTGEWFIIRSEDNSYYGFPFGEATDIPVAADFDGDGKADPTVFRPSTQVWYILKSTGGTQIQQFGSAGDLPVAADYDGDKKADVAIFRPSVSEWWIQKSTGGSLVYQFGANGDKAVPADYTGDGKADVAFYRPTTGEWYVIRSENQSFYAAPFGVEGDLPVAGDYDGDGKADFAVFRPSTNGWFINKSNGGTQILSFGQTGDKPTPNAFVP